MPLSEFVSDNEQQNLSKINVYVGLLDRFGSQSKSPGIFRFELYEHLQRSAREKGRRVAIWPDIDLTDAQQNNFYWNDFLRAYRFELDFEPQGEKKYVLQVTCICPNETRLTGQYVLKSPD